MNANDTDKKACQRANETAEKRRTRLEGDAARKANARTNETPDKSICRKRYARLVSLSLLPSHPLKQLYDSSLV